MNWKSLYRVALWVLIGSVAISALLGIYALFSRELDDFGARTLGTTLFVSATALLVMSNSAIIEEKPRGYFYLSIVGLVMALVALPVFLTALWQDNAAESHWKLGVSLEIVSIVTAHSALLTLWRLPSKYQFLLPIATALAVALGSLIVIVIWTEESERGLWQIAGTLAILVTAITIIVPVIPRLVALDAPDAAAGGVTYALRHCPNCGVVLTPGTRAGSKSTCVSCGAPFTVKFG